jgi:hypothetical protein
MAAIHILLPDGSQPVYEDFEIPEMLRLGQLTPETYFWQPGMPEWRRLSELLSRLTPASRLETPATPDPEPRRSRSIQDLTAFTVLLQVSLAILTVMDLLHFLGDLSQFVLLSGPPYTHEAAHLNDLRQRILGGLVLFFFFLTAIFYCLWIYRANRNCRRWGGQRMKFTPSWSVWVNFIPILCLYEPYQAMKEIWCVSTDPVRWPHQKGSPLLVSWWTLWLIASILGNIVFQASRHIHDRSSALLLTDLELALHSLKAVMNALLFVIVYKILQKQKRLAEDR